LCCSAPATRKIVCERLAVPRPDVPAPLPAEVGAAVFPCGSAARVRALECRDIRLSERGGFAAPSPGKVEISAWCR
jgi:hypothetical protein